MAKLDTQCWLHVGMGNLNTFYFTYVPLKDHPPHRHALLPGERLMVRDGWPVTSAHVSKFPLAVAWVLHLFTICVDSAHPYKQFKPVALVKSYHASVVIWDPFK